MAKTPKTETAEPATEPASVAGIRSTLAVIGVSDAHHAAAQRVGHSPAQVVHAIVGALADCRAGLLQLANMAVEPEASQFRALAERLA
jgi:hypothetical protein